LPKKLIEKRAPSFPESTRFLAGKLTSEAGSRTQESTERIFQRHKEKLQELDLWLPELKANLREFFNISTNVRGIFLQIDDLYHLKRADQAFIVDYIPL
jgi:hypothetical protein